MTEAPEPDRRNFLTGNAAASVLREAIEAGQQAATDIVAGSEAPEVPAVGSPGSAVPLGISRSQSHLETYSTRAMACEFEILFNLHQYRGAGAAAMRAFEMLDSIESQLSIYRAKSELSCLNSMACQQDVKVDSQLFELLSLGKLLYEQTGGAFDMTSGPLTNVWGFDQRKGRVPDGEQIEEALQLVGSDQLQLDRRAQTVRFGRRGMRLNPGGIGKGFALDRIAEWMTDTADGAGIGDFVIHGGQSSVVACGSIDPYDRPTGWKVGVTHPLAPATRLGEVRLRDAALGTSGSVRQGFFDRGKRYGHIIDPRTGNPSDCLLSSTVISSSAARADALATAFFVMQPEEVESYCRIHSDVAAILVVPDDREDPGGPFSVCRINLRDEDWTEV